MLDTDQIIMLRTTLRHAADHLDEVREAIRDEYHDGSAAPADVNQQLCPLLNTIEEYAQELRQALVTMVTGGLSDDGSGDWFVGDQGPYDTLAEALRFRDDDDTRFVTQAQYHAPGED